MAYLQSAGVREKSGLLVECWCKEEKWLTCRVPVQGRKVVLEELWSFEAKYSLIYRCFAGQFASETKYLV